MLAQITALSPICGLVLLLGACGSETFGVLYSDTYQTGDATIIRTRGFGAQVRIRNENPGIDIGLTERLYVFETGDGGDLPPTGRTYFFIPVPNRETLARVDMTIGAAMSLYGPGLMLGVGQRAILARVASGTSMAMTMAIDIDRPENSNVLLHCSGEEACR